VLGVLALGSACATSSRSASSAAPPSPPEDSVIVYLAGSLNQAFRELSDSFVARHPGVAIRLESGGSVDLARRSLAVGQAPDLLALADYRIIPRLLLSNPRGATWYAQFAGNAMVILYTDRSRAAAEINQANWVDLLLRGGLRAGHSDPARDPAGYRARLVFALAERYYRRPGLARALDSAVPTVTVPTGRTLLDLLRTGELDYFFAYRTTALNEGLPYLALPAAIDLSDPALAATYREARVRVAQPSADSAEIAGEPIIYGLTVPSGSRHPKLGQALAALVLGEVGRGVLERAGFVEFRNSGIPELRN
jgi:molybdate/tungstate transport system substrate-binding protein